jgi:predicted deacetylase
VTARLVVSVSGINARTLDRCAELGEELARRGVPLSLLFAPRVAGTDQSETAVAWVQQRHRTGDALLLHGVDDTTQPRGRSVAFGRRAEFAALPAHEAGLRLTAATALLDRLGLTADGFAPPRWLASQGTLRALRSKGFTLCADLTAVRDLRTGVLHRGRVQGLKQGDRAEPWWCYALVLGAARTARRSGLVRLAADAATLYRSGPRQALLDAVDIAMQHGARGTTYPGVLTDRPARAA